MCNTEKQQTAKHQRRKYYIDREVQGSLMKQAMLHWFWTMITFGLVILLYRVAPVWLSGVDDPSGHLWYHLGPFVLASAVLFPAILYTSIRFSHRFAGPMVRARRTLKQLADGEHPEELRFRDTDHWAEIAVDINRVAARLAEGRSSQAEGTSHEQSPPFGGVTMSSLPDVKSAPPQSLS